MVEVLLPSGRCSIEEIAERLGVDRRTVHRRGETFSVIVVTVRTEMVTRYIENPDRSLATVADMLGLYGAECLLAVVPHALRLQRHGRGALQTAARRLRERADEALILRLFHPTAETELSLRVDYRKTRRRSPNNRKGIEGGGGRPASSIAAWRGIRSSAECGNPLLGGSRI